MAYSDTGKPKGTLAARAAQGVVARLAKSTTARVTAIALRRVRSPDQIIAAQHRAEAHRRAVDRLVL